MKKSLRLAGAFIPLILAFWTWNVLAGTPSLQFTRYTQANGLSTGSISQIFRDKVGYFWMLSESDLVRFDGYNFKIIRNDPNDSTSLPESLTNMKMDDEGTIYLSAAGSISRYDVRKGVFTRLLTASVHNPVYDWVFDSGSRFWATTKDYLISFDGRSNVVKKYQLPASFNRIAMRISCAGGNVWIVNNTGDILRFNKVAGTFSKVPLVENGHEIPTVRGNPYTIQRDRNRSTWLLTDAGYFSFNEMAGTFVLVDSLDTKNDEALRGDGLLVDGWFYSGNSRGELISMDCNNGTIHRIPLGGLASPEKRPGIYSIYPGYDGSIWVSTTTSGVFHYMPKTETWEQFRYEEGNRNSLLSNTTDFIYAEEKNLVWINCPGRGTVKVEWIEPFLPAYNPNTDPNDPSRMVTENVRTIFSLDSNHLLIGTLGGLKLFDTKSRLFSQVKSPVDSKPILEHTPIAHIISDHRGDIWISIWGTTELYRLNYALHELDSMRVDSTLSNFTTLRTLYYDSRDNLWAGSDASILYRANLKPLYQNGAAKIKFEKLTGREYPALEGFRQCFSILEYKGELLFGLQNGFCIFNYNSGKFNRYTRSPGGLSDNNIRAVCIDRDGSFWLGTYHGGLNKFNPATGKCQVFTEKNGLSDNTIYSIVEGRKEDLWLGTNKGLCRFNRRNYSCRNFTMKDGIQNYEYNTNGATVLPGGLLAIAGRTGFNLFDPDSIDPVSDAPPVVITQLNVFNRELNLNDTIRLKYNENSVSFQFAALGFFRNEENQYAYRLDGVDKDWVYCGDRRFTNYSNLAPGKYTFHVKASNCFGVWNETGSHVMLLIGTPWWETLYFRIGLIVLVSVLVYLFFLYRLRQRFKLVNVRNRIARDLHDEIGSNLSSISLFSEVAGEKARDQVQAVVPLLKKISEYTQVSQEAMSDIVWMINARNDRFENIIVHMRTLAAELLEAKNIVLHLDFDEKLNHLKMDMDRRKNFYLVYKEAVNNVVKYAECKNTWILLTLHRSTVKLTIRDDGKGFDTFANSRGNGLVNMKRRAVALGGELNIQSEPGKGSTIELTFKI